MEFVVLKEDEFKNRYCAVNKITSRNNKVQDECLWKFLKSIENF